MIIKMIQELRKRMDVQSEQLQDFFFQRVRKYKKQPTTDEEYNNGDIRIAIKLTKFKYKEKILKQQKEKQHTQKSP